MLPVLSAELVETVTAKVLADLATGSMKSTYESMCSHDDPAMVVVRREYFAYVVARTTQELLAATATYQTTMEHVKPDNHQWAITFIAQVDEALQAWIKLGNRRPPGDHELAKLLNDQGVRTITGMPIKPRTMYRYLQDFSYDKRKRFWLYLDALPESASPLATTPKSKIMETFPFDTGVKR